MSLWKSHQCVYICLWLTSENIFELITASARQSIMHRELNWLDSCPCVYSEDKPVAIHCRWTWRQLNENIKLISNM